MKSKFLLIFFLFIAFGLNALSQNKSKVDSLVAELENSKTCSDSILIYNDLCWTLRNSDPNQSLEYGYKALKLADSTNILENFSKTKSFIGVAYRNIGNYDSALTYYYQSLYFAKEQKNREQQGYGYINLGNLYFLFEQYPFAKIYLDSAKALNLNVKKIDGYINYNMGQYYTDLKKFDSARICLDNAIIFRETIYDKEGKASCLKLIGDIYNREDSIESAKEYYFQSENLLDADADKDLVSALYNELAILYLKTGQTDSALYYCEISLQNATELNSKLRLRNVYSTYQKIYKKIGLIDSAYKFQTEVIILNDSLFNDKMSQKLASAKFQNEIAIAAVKFQKEIAIASVNLERQREKTRLFAIIASVIFVFVIIFFLLYSKIKKFNKLLQISNEEIKQQKNIVDQKNVEITQKNEELKAQNEEIIKQRDEISDQKRQITDSITYACRIQDAILFTEANLNKFFKDAFIFFKPRDIVSGDFYWYRKIDTKIIVIAADCTGHGVPGAFMSLLGISALEEIVFSKNILIPSEVLELLRKTIKTSLKQSMDVSHSRDGIDMAICTFDTVSKKLLFSGANNPIYIISENELKIYDANFNSAGIDLVEKPFKQHEINYNDNDLVYMFSDGYIDQFNQKRERFKSSRLKKLLLEINQKNMSEQHEILDSTLTDWQNNFRQIDDILIMGIRL